MSEAYNPILINEYCPCDRRRRYEYIQEIKIPVECQRYPYTGANEHLHWIWRTSVDETRSEALNNYTRVTVDLQSKLPVYASRFLKREFIHTYGRCTGLKPALL